jgi:hypothetical protein
MTNSQLPPENDSAALLLNAAFPSRPCHEDCRDHPKFDVFEIERHTQEAKYRLSIRPATRESQPCGAGMAHCTNFGHLFGHSRPPDAPARHGELHYVICHTGEKPNSLPRACSVY